EHKNRVLSATDDWQAVEVARSHPSEKKIDTWEDPASWDAHQVVAVGNDSAQSTQDDMIKEVVSTDGRADGFHHPGDSKVAEEQDGQGMDEKELQDASEVEHKDGSDASENNIAGTHPAANLTSSLEKVKFIREDQSIAWQGRSSPCLPLLREGVNYWKTVNPGRKTNLGLNLVP
uniref:Uncharacterized protein n=1 Tax=Aegilops tauschii subsp. strangulata TaxID=200361 RepID=A0A453L2D4_AEGTS